MPGQDAESIKKEIPTLMNKYQDTATNIKLRGLVAELSRGLKEVNDIGELTIIRNTLDSIIEGYEVQYENLTINTGSKNKLIEIESILNNQRRNPRGGGPKMQVNY